MKRTLTCSFLLAVVGLFTFAGVARAQTPLFRLSANFDGEAEKFAATGAPLDNGGLATAGGGGGVVIFQKTVFQPNGKNVLFITFSGTGDTHNGAALVMSCSVDGVLCGGLGGDPIGACAQTGTPTGWLCLQKMVVPTSGSTNCDDGGGGAGDCHDNNINQTFCAVVEKGPRTVQLKLGVIPNAPTTTSGIAFVEGSKYYVDSTNFTSGDGCTEYVPPGSH